MTSPQSPVFDQSDVRLKSTVDDELFKQDFGDSEVFLRFDWKTKVLSCQPDNDKTNGSQPQLS